MTRWLCALAGYTLLLCMLALGLAPTEPTTSVQAADEEKFSAYVDAKGNIALPANYATTFLHLGTFAVAPKADKPVATLNGVYARPEDVKAYQRDGKFPDGAVIVKEVFEVKSENFTAAEHSYATKIKHWFVMIKDTKGRFKGNALWGEGWGWAFFESKDPKKQVATDYRTECRGCHLPVKKDDWLHVQGFPVLREKGTEK